MKKILFVVLFALIGCDDKQVETEIFSGQGCCSYRGGQCGCANNRVMCCDGSLSPSCKC